MLDVNDVYVGSGTGRILRFELDWASGALTQKDEVNAGVCPSFLAMHAQQPVLLAVDENEDAVGSFKIEDDGSLKFLNRVPSGGSGPAYVSIAQNGELAFVANYGGGTIAVLAIAPSGQLRHALQTDAPGKHPHAILTDPSSRFVYVPMLGSDLVAQYRLDLVTNTLRATDSAPVATAKGEGPRHLAFTPSGSYAYLVHEHTSQLSAYRVLDNGALEVLQTISTLPENYQAADNTGADVHVAPSGRFVYVSNRGHNSIAIFSIGSDGKLELVGHESTRGEIPRNFALCGDGARLLVANLRSDSIASFAVDEERGTLTHLATTQNVPSPFWVGMKPKPKLS